MAQETITRQVSLAKGASNFFTFSAPSMPMTFYTWWMASCTVADKSKQQLREKSGAENRSWDTWYEGISDVNLSGTPRIWIKNNDTEYAEYNVSLILWYEETAHNITVTAGTGGSASVNFSTANPGDTPTVTVTPSAGYSANTPTAPGITFTSAGTNKWTFTMPAEDVAISCTFTHVVYTIGVSAGTGGTASVNMETAYYGDTPTVTCTPSSGYKANTPTCSGVTFTSAGTNKWTYTQPAKNVTISCTFSKISYNVTASAGTGGTASSNKSTAQIGDTVTITCSPNTGYKANTPTCSGVTFTSAGTNKWSFTMPAKAVTVSCTFSKISYTITTANSPAAGGTLTASKNSANYQDEITLTATAAAGYVFNKFTSSPTLTINAGKYSMPAQNVTVTANWTKVYYNVTVNAGTGGGATADVVSAQIGDTVTITCAPNSGYKANKPTATGITFTAAGTNNWTFTMPAAPVTVSCTFSKVSYNITVSAGTGGSASSSAASAQIGDTVTITCSPNTGYKANTPTCSGVTFTSAGTNKWSFSMPAKAVTVSCTFSKISYTITTANSPAAGGTLTASKNSANYQDEITLTPTAASGYQFSSYTTSPTLTISSNKFSMPAQNVTVTANWTKVDYNVTVNAGTGGTASSDKSTAQIGDTVTITSTPSSGYKANKPTASGITFTAAGTNKWTFSMPAAAVTVSCTFTKIDYAVTVTAGSGGSASTSKAKANKGDTITITCSPNPGYKANTPTASGISFTAAGTNKWTFTMPAAAVTVSCTFSKINYTITTAASPAAGGSLAVSKNPANYNDTITLTPTAASGYQFSSYTTSPTVTVSSNQFIMPASAITVTAKFTKLSYNVTVSAGTGGTASSSAASAQVGDTVTITCAPGTGYKANKPTCSGVTFTSAGTNKWSFTMPAKAVTVSCTFSKLAYTVTVSAGANGSATASKTSANYQDTITITASPNTGYKANTPTASGISFTAAGTNKWTFTMPAAATTVSITFSKVSYAITKKTSPNGAGTVTTSANSATMGTEVTVSQTPASDAYHFNGWTVTPDSVTISSGTFTMPAQAVTIQANYLKRSTGTLNKTSMDGGSTVTLTIVPDKTTYKHKYKLSFGSGMETSLTEVAAGTTSVTISVPLNWSAQIPSATSKTGGTLTLETYNGNTKIGTYTISNLTYNVPASVVPSVGTITTSIARTIGGVTYANIGNIYTQSKCGVRVQTTAAGNQSSTIASIQVTLSGYTDAGHKKTVSQASVDWTSGLLTNSGTCTITVKATDSRGRTATKTKNIAVTAYNKPSGTLRVWRVDEDGNEDPLGTYAKYEKTNTYSNIGNNSLTVTLTGGGGSATNPAASGNILPNSRKTFAQLSEYNISLTLVDAFETVTITVKLPTAQFMIYVNEDGDRIGFMQATKTTRSKNGKSGTIEFSGNHQIYIGDTMLEDYIDNQNVYQQYFLWNDTTINQAQFIAKCESMMDRPGLYFLGYINYNVATRIGFTINGYVIGRYHNDNFKHIEVISSATDSHAGQRELLIKTSTAGWYGTIVGIPNSIDIFYRPGDTVNAAYYGEGHLTSAGTLLRMVFSMPKRMTYVTSATLLEGSRFTIRGINGYVDEFNNANTVEVVGNSDYTVTTYFTNNRCALEIDIKKNTAFTQQNNTVIQATVNPLKIRFD